EAPPYRPPRRAAPSPLRASRRSHGAHVPAGLRLQMLVEHRADRADEGAAELRNLDAGSAVVAQEPVRLELSQAVKLAGKLGNGPAVGGAGLAKIDNKVAHLRLDDTRPETVIGARHDPSR